MADFDAHAFDETLRHYRAGQFTDGDVSRCTGLSARAFRQLIRARALRTIPEHSGPGRGRVRLCDAVALKRAAVIAPLIAAGFSAFVAGQIAYQFPYHTLLYSVCDPIVILFDTFDRSASIDPISELPLRRPVLLSDWFEPDRPSMPDPASDWLLEVYDGRFVGCLYGVKAGSSPVIFGDLRNERTNFVAWQPSHDPSQVSGSVIARLAEELLPQRRFVDFVADWENPNKFPRELKRLGYKYEMRAADDALRITAQSVAHNFTFKTSVNVSLAVKNALRRYLKLELAIAA